jgi:hypothetical protein
VAQDEIIKALTYPVRFSDRLLDVQRTLNADVEAREVRSAG